MDGVLILPCYVVVVYYENEEFRENHTLSFETIYA